MRAKEIRPYIPCRDFEHSKSFYSSLGFTEDPVHTNLSIFQNGNVSFFLYQDETGQESTQAMFQLIVEDIDAAFATVSGLHGFDFKFEPIKTELWGKVIYLWGPSGESWHITQLDT